MILGLIDEAVRSGARLEPACRIVGLTARTVQRWRKDDVGEDRRKGPQKPPANKLSQVEEKRILQVANNPEFRELSPKQIVPELADRGEYLASESSFYRVLRANNLANHRERSRPAQGHKPRELVATGPWQVLTWDITYLPTTVAGMFFYLYMVVDIWSRKILRAEVHAQESMDLAAEFIERTFEEAGVDPEGTAVHADNGSPMKGCTMVVKMQKLGLRPSYSRPGVCDDNPFSESLFRTMKYRPDYPDKPLESVEKWQAWVDAFKDWHDTVHLHSGIKFVTPEDRHAGRDVEILENRRRVYEQAKARHPERWSGEIRDWTPVGAVVLNPDNTKTVDATERKLAA